MPRVKLNLDVIRFINLFESVTGAKVKDCIVQESRFIFILQPGEIAKAIGKKGNNIRKIEGILNKSIKLIEYNEILEEYIKNVVHPLKLVNIEKENGTVTLEAIDNKTRGMLIGRNAMYLREYESLVKRHFDITELKVR